MPLFECDECGIVDNTALAPFYWKRRNQRLNKLCTECLTGEWHYRFERYFPDGMLIDQDGHLWDKKTVEDGNLPEGYKIVGEVK
jgi:hypothetical protein